MKILKRIVIGLVVLVVIFIGAGFAASRYINKELVESQVTAATGREFKISGDLKSLISLTPSVSAEGVTLANAKWGSRPQLASISKFKIQMELLPLLQKKIVVDKVDIDNADILLEQKNNQWNFAFDQTTAKAEDEKTKPTSEKSPLSFAVSSLNITNSKLTLIQGSSPLTVNIKEMKLAPHDKMVTFNFDGTVNDKPLKVSVDLPPVADLMSAKTIDISNLNVTSDDMTLKANAQVDSTTQKVVISSLDVSKGVMSVSGKGTADINAKKVLLDSLTLKNGDMKFTGNISADASGKVPYISGSLATDAIEIKSPAKTSTAAPSNPTPSDKAPATTNDKLPLDQLSAANADLKLSVGKFTSGNIVLEKINASVKLNNGVLSISPLTANFANGQIASSLSVSKGGMKVNLKASNLLMEKILAETAGNNDFKNGVTNADLALSSSGDTINSLEGTLSGTSKVTVGSGVYSGQILKGHASQLTTLLTGNNSKEVDINCAVVDMNWASGTGSLQQMGVDTKYANLTGTGQIKLPNNDLNLVLTPTSKLSSLNGLAVPISVKGTANDPVVLPMVQKMLQSAAKNLLSQASGGGKINLKSVLGGGSSKSSSGQTGSTTITSPCGAASAPAPAAAANNGAAATTPAVQQPAQAQTPQSKLNNKLQKWGF